jgi:hypothetical protein
MRLMRRCRTSLAGGLGLLSLATLGMAVFCAGPALAAVANSPGGAIGVVTPSSAAPGSQVTFAVSCVSSGASSATLFGSVLGLPEHVPMDNGLHAGTFAITVTLPANIKPGTYSPEMDCSDGSTGNATLTVTATMPAHGGVETGDGTTSTQTNTGLAAAGLALIGLGAVAGGIALRRRRNASRLR